MKRPEVEQELHDAAIAALCRQYEEYGWVALQNPGQEQNYPVQGCFVDVIARAEPDADDQHLIEIETTSSINMPEARQQWQKFDRKFAAWHLFVPYASYSRAASLLVKFHIKNCYLSRWESFRGNFSFEHLPLT